ncbi:class III signal peptide-containing protein [Phoenicibacter congonensis]|uniref:class III signal peptide-containing protein n=1 Tax=Phoenicibacter congonensis TaxID=1944646 RepID=UPI0009A6A080|nr:class III signal peptide-containing protein [Phoenicibacter congonensis]
MDLSIWKAVRKHSRIAVQRLSCAFCNLQSKLVCKKGQGTTEYAILVGVLVVIAILAIAVFKPKLQELWDAISDGMNSL